MNAKSALIIAAIVFIFTGCASENIQVRKLPDSAINAGLEDLRQEVADNGVPGEWFDDQMDHYAFRLHHNIDRFFRKSAEKKTDSEKKRSLLWYFSIFGVETKIEKGKTFIEDYTGILERAEAKHGIHKELIAAIIGMETNFAQRRYRGKFYAFNSLVSQYIFTDRKKFAVREITSLYKFSEKTDRSPWYFKSSYAGAIGWGQFIPSSLLSFFIDENGDNDDIDPFSIEDTIFSVENYLYRHGLSGKNVHKRRSRYKAVYAYNHSDAYVQAVLHIYDGLKN
ncbi:MAG TPA: lytic murein transglycosylase [Smithella sp.]|jgi:membrane-bound lytic murein transglycosylase B|nr:lytic murein transglycosylase [Smithella sp.]NMC97935.1 hypothetical protein [Deltaproteobacteria bacterium]OQC54065.1 MAG: Membrane-bound lytic murein transglycosylase B precursor [Deltaproteobacteria bacterium ADurb.Bin022]HNQ65018.1 lytic murein transglycosylase [Smithella sp.]HOE32314.1 lytic murein transglycosylase [Smithella sp.]